MLRYCLLLVAVSVAIVAAAFAAPAGPITAGTAPGSLTGHVARAEYHAGLHYPINWTVLATKPNGAPPKPTNYTAPYDEWADPGLVRGHRPAMTSDLCVMASHRRGTPHKEAST
jgi:hypothetical protein